MLSFMLQAKVRLTHGDRAHVLGLIFYSDAAEAERHGHKFHPLIVYLANYRLDALRSARGYRRFALLPILDAKNFPGLSASK